VCSAKCAASAFGLAFFLLATHDSLFAVFLDNNHWLDDALVIGQIHALQNENAAPLANQHETAPIP
jgi:hypothetical protein